MIVTELWNFKYSEPILGMALGDINSDDSTEILAYTKSGKILLLSLSGKLLFEQEISENSSIWCAKIHDIDRDGINELILGGMDGILRVFKCKSESFDLEPFWAHQFGSSISGILIDDVSNDKKEELIVYSLDKSIRVINPLNGELVWGEVFEDGIGDAIVWTNDDLARHLKEIFACGNDGTIRIYAANNGELLWNKRFFEKIRCISGINSKEGPLVLCGGDDKILHFIDKEDQIEMESIEFNDYIWKILSYPHSSPNKALVSTYSFAFLEEESIPIEEIKFTSKLVSIDDELNIEWELNGKNIESLRLLEKQESIYIHLGTTTGDVIILNPQNGEILSKINQKSCTNMTLDLLKNNLLFSCHDNGSVFAYFLEDY